MEAATPDKCSQELGSTFSGELQLLLHFKQLLASLHPVVAGPTPQGFPTLAVSMHQCTHTKELLAAFPCSAALKVIASILRIERTYFNHTIVYYCTTLRSRDSGPIVQGAVQTCSTESSCPDEVKS